MRYTSGNAIVDGINGWFIGQFVGAEGGLRRRHDVEVKWGIHPQGERRAGSWVKYRTATTISILLQGEILIQVRAEGRVDAVRLRDAGDYIVLPPMSEHTWEALSDCVVLTVRCPSVSGDVSTTAI